MLAPRFLFLAVAVAAMNSGNSRAAVWLTDCSVEFGPGPVRDSKAFIEKIRRAPTSQAKVRELLSALEWVRESGLVGSSTARDQYILALELIGHFIETSRQHATMKQQPAMRRHPDDRPAQPSVSPQSVACGTASWVMHFASALSDLNDGIIVPLFEPLDRKSRATPSAIWRSRALVAFGFHLLVKAGGSLQEIRCMLDDKAEHKDLFRLRHLVLIGKKLGASAESWRETLMKGIGNKDAQAIWDRLVATNNDMRSMSLVDRAEILFRRAHDSLSGS